MGVEIERKWRLHAVPENLLVGIQGTEFLQGYLCTKPVVRVRREGTQYWLTYKGAGHLQREEYNLPLTEEAFQKLLPSEAALSHSFAGKIGCILHEMCACGGVGRFSGGIRRSAFDGSGVSGYCDCPSLRGARLVWSGSDGKPLFFEFLAEQSYFGGYFQ